MSGRDLPRMIILPHGGGSGQSQKAPGSRRCCLATRLECSPAIKRLNILVMVMMGMVSVMVVKKMMIRMMLVMVRMVSMMIAMVMVVMIVMVTCGSVEVPLVSQMNLKCFTTAATILRQKTLKYYIQLRAICQYCVFYCCEENMGQLSPSKAVCPCSAFMA